MNMNFEGAELSLYSTNGTFSFALSDVQLAAVIKLLGLKPSPGNGVSCYSDDTLHRFSRMEGNPLALREISSEK